MENEDEGENDEEEEEETEEEDDDNEIGDKENMEALYGWLQLSSLFYSL